MHPAVIVAVSIMTTLEVVFRAMQIYFLPHTEACQPPGWVDPPFGLSATLTSDSVSRHYSQYLLEKSSKAHMGICHRIVTTGDSRYSMASAAPPTFLSVNLGTWPKFLALRFFSSKMGRIVIIIIMGRIIISYPSCRTFLEAHEVTQVY